jgi:hypothetical protein
MSKRGKKWNQIFILGFLRSRYFFISLQYMIFDVFLINPKNYEQINLYLEGIIFMPIITLVIALLSMILVFLKYGEIYYGPFVCFAGVLTLIGLFFCDQIWALNRYFIIFCIGLLCGVLFWGFFSRKKIFR